MAKKLHEFLFVSAGLQLFARSQQPAQIRRIGVLMGAAVESSSL